VPGQRVEECPGGMTACRAQGWIFRLFAMTVPPPAAMTSRGHRSRSVKIAEAVPGQSHKSELDKPTAALSDYERLVWKNYLRSKRLSIVQRNSAMSLAKTRSNRHSGFSAGLKAGSLRSGSNDSERGKWSSDMLEYAGLGNRLHDI
jgi:hypothetical protein